VTIKITFFFFLPDINKKIIYIYIYVFFFNKNTPRARRHYIIVRTHLIIYTIKKKKIS
jgi:hypothetical protein